MKILYIAFILMLPTYAPHAEENETVKSPSKLYSVYISNPSQTNTHNECVYYPTSFNQATSNPASIFGISAQALADVASQEHPSGATPQHSMRLECVSIQPLPPYKLQMISAPFFFQNEVVASNLPLLTPVDNVCTGDNNQTQNCNSIATPEPQTYILMGLLLALALFLKKQHSTSGIS